MEKCKALEVDNLKLKAEKGELERSHEYFAQLKGILPRKPL